jgi:hypothetical protein
MARLIRKHVEIRLFKYLPYASLLEIVKHLIDWLLSSIGLTQIDKANGGAATI